MTAVQNNYGGGNDHKVDAHKGNENTQHKCGCTPGNESNARTEKTEAGKVRFENDSNVIEIKKTTIDITNKKTGETYKVWGDPHVNVDGKQAFDFYGTTTFNLEDGTKLTVDTTPGKGATYSKTVTITNGDYGVQVGGVDTGKLTHHEFHGKGQALDQAVRDGNSIFENIHGKGFVGVDEYGNVRKVDQQWMNATDERRGGQPAPEGDNQAQRVEALKNQLAHPGCIPNGGNVYGGGAVYGGGNGQGNINQYANIPNGGGMNGGVNGGMNGGMQGMGALTQALTQLLNLFRDVTNQPGMQSVNFNGSLGYGGADNGGNGMRALINFTMTLIDLLQMLISQDRMGGNMQNGQPYAGGAMGGQGGANGAGNQAGVIADLANKLGGQQPAPNVIDTKGGWIAQHGGYEKLEDGTYKITKGDYAGHTMKYTGEKGVFHVFDKYGNCIGQWTSKNGGEKVASPIGLDLNGSGRIETTGQTTAKDGQRTAVGETVDFDIDADGQMDKVEWFAGNGDGILVDTAKIGANGNIDGSALFGDEGGKFANGYDKLAARDANGDGRISGDEMNGLAVWVDDGDAVLEAGELQTLAAHDIKSINATMNMDAEGRMISSATRGDGSSVYTEDVWFAQQA